MWHAWRRDTGIWSENLKQVDHLQYPRVAGMIVLIWILKKYDGRPWNRFCVSGWGHVTISCEDGNE